MSTRCKACNEELDILTSTNIDGVSIIEELCSSCLSAAVSEWNYDHEGILPDAEDGPTPQVGTDDT